MTQLTEPWDSVFLIEAGKVRIAACQGGPSLARHLSVAPTEGAREVCPLSTDSSSVFSGIYSLFLVMLKWQTLEALQDG